MGGCSSESHELDALILEVLLERDDLALSPFVVGGNLAFSHA